MDTESWLPIGFELPDGANCCRVLYSGSDWQILETRGGGSALLAEEVLVSKWVKIGLLSEGEMPRFSFGQENFCETSCGPSQLLVPIADCRSPNNKSEALAFAAALRDTRLIDPQSPLQDAIYIEKFSRLLPTYQISSKTEDDVILGYWLTGGVNISVKSFRRLHQMLSWMPTEQLRKVVETAGFIPVGIQSAEQNQDEIASENITSKAISLQPLETQPKPFQLPGRPELEAFFNENIIDIVHHRERYSALGVDLPAAILLYGPPGCGKTFAVEQLIAYLDWPSFQVDAASVASPYIHETSKKISDLFEKSIQNAPSVLVIDEMDAFLAERETGNGHHRVEEMAEFLRRIPEAGKNGVLIVGMTNRIDMIDSAIMRRGRFDHIIKVDYASEKEICALLDKMLTLLPRDESVDSLQLAKILVRRPLSDVAFIVREGARLAARAGSNQLKQEFLLEAFEKSPARICGDAINRIGFV